MGIQWKLFIPKLWSQMHIKMLQYIMRLYRVSFFLDYTLNLMEGKESTHTVWHTLYRASSEKRSEVRLRELLQNSRRNKHCFIVGVATARDEAKTCYADNTAQHYPWQSWHQSPNGYFHLPKRYTKFIQPPARVNTYNYAFFPRTIHLWNQLIQNRFRKKTHSAHQ